MIEPCYQAPNPGGILQAPNPGGILIADNIFYTGKVLGLTREQERKYAKGVADLKDFNKRMAEHPGFETEFFPLADGILAARRVD